MLGRQLQNPAKLQRCPAADTYQECLTSVSGLGGLGAARGFSSYRYHFLAPDIGGQAAPALGERKEELDEEWES